jgi:pilus assembly protein Flp/PilA
LREAKLIDARREAGMSLADIASLLREPSCDQLDAWERRVEIDATRRQPISGPERHPWSRTHKRGEWPIPVDGCSCHSQRCTPIKNSPGSTTDRRGSIEMDLFLIKAWLKARLNVDSERGATMVEYVLILALIAILVIGVVAALGHSVSSKFSEASSGIG